MSVLLYSRLVLFCYERDFITSISNDNQPDIIEEFIPTSRYLIDLLNIDNLYFEVWSIEFIYQKGN